MFGNKYMLIALAVIGLITAQVLGAAYLVQQASQIIQSTYTAMATSFEGAMVNMIYNGRNILGASF